MRLLLVYLLLGCALLSPPVLAERAKIGLALAGGGAKGSAHIAVLEFLETHNIPVDYIAGTSIGAYVGGLYALGYNAEQIKRIVYGADLDRGYSDAIERRRAPYRDKRQMDKFNIPLEAGYRDGQLRFPSGLLYGQSVSGIYRSSVGNITNLESFDDLAIPYRAVATDLTTSNTVVLDRGNLIKAMQASATVPGALVPIELDGRYLVDGGISANIPIDVVKQMGADIVIAVDISSPLLAKESLDNSFTILRQISTFLTLRNINEQKQLLGERDIYIRPDVQGLSFTDFSNLEKAFDAGAVAVQQQQQVLKSLAIDATEFQRYTIAKQQKLELIRRKGAQPLADIILLNNSRVNDAYLLETLDISLGNPISTEQIIAAVDRLYALDRFQRVDAEIEQRDAGLTLVVDTQEKSWGPNYFEMGLGWEDDFTLDSVIDLDFAYTLGSVTDNGGEWRNELGLGTNKSLISELYLPIDDAQNFYHAEQYEYNRISRDYFINNQRAVIFEQISHRVDLSLGYKLKGDAVLELGITWESGRFGNELVSQDDLSYQSEGVFLRVGYDSLDRLSFPTQGNRYHLSVSHREEDVSGVLIDGTASVASRYFSTQFRGDWKGAASSGNHGLVGKASFTYLSSESDQSIFFDQLGGFLNLSGYHKNALVGNNKLFGALSYQYDLGKSVLGFQGFPLYLGVSVELGNVWASSQSVSASDLIAAGSLFLSTDTALGPVALGFGFAEHNINSIYFYLGKNI